MARAPRSWATALPGGGRSALEPREIELARAREMALAALETDDAVSARELASALL